jgi:hypothetical protein
MRRKALGIVLISAIAVMAIGAQVALAGPVQSLTACLKIEPKEPLGTAVYQWWDDDTRRLEIEVAGVEDGNYCIFVDKDKLDVKLVVTDGAGALRLDTRWGDVVPVIESGSTIALKYCVDTTIVVCGKFA